MQSCTHTHIPGSWRKREVWRGSWKFLAFLRLGHDYSLVFQRHHPPSSASAFPGQHLWATGQQRSTHLDSRVCFLSLCSWKSSDVSASPKRDPFTPSRDDSKGSSKVSMLVTSAWSAPCILCPTLSPSPLSSLGHQGHQPVRVGFPGSSNLLRLLN